MTDSVHRFADRVADYDRWRPDYPEAAVELLVDRGGLGPGRVVADVGSGTGILSEQLLPSGAAVIGVEPGDEMRAQAARRIGEHAGFSQREGTSDATGLVTNVEYASALPAGFSFVTKVVPEAR